MNEHNQHNEHDEFEAELAALRPIQPSVQLKERIADRLAEPIIPASGIRRSRGPLWLAAICGPIAAVLTFFLLSGGSDKSEPFLNLPDLGTQSAITAFDKDLPTLWSYRPVISQSPAELDALLDKHAQHSPEPKPQRAGAFVSVFARSDSQLDDLLGEF